MRLRVRPRKTKVYSPAQQVHRQDDSFTSQAWSVDSQSIARDQVNQVQGQAQHLLDQASFNPGPVLLPQGQGRSLLFLVVAIWTLYGDEIFSLELDNETALRIRLVRRLWIV